MTMSSDYGVELTTEHRKRVLFLAARTSLPDGAIPPHGSGAHVAATLAGLGDHFDVLPLLAESSMVVAPSRGQPLRRLVPARLRGLRHDILLFRSDRRLAARALDAARDFRPDIIYERSEYFGTAGLTVARKLGVPLVLEVNGLFDHEARLQYRSLAEPLGVFLERLKYARAATIVVESPGMASALRDRGADPTKIVIVPNAVPAWKVRPEPSPVVPDRAVVGWIGHLMPWYLDALALLLRAAAGVVEVRPDVRFRIVAGGAGVERLAALIDSSGLSAFFELRGPVDYEQVPEVLEGFDVGVVPAAFDYQFPVKLVEMGGAGLPVIAPRTSSIEGLLTAGKEFEPFNPGDVADLERAIVEVVSDLDRRRRLGRALHEAVKERFTWAAVGSQLAAVVNRASEGSGD